MKKMTNYTERVFKGTITVFLFSILGMFIAYLFRIFLARNLSIEDFGLFYAVIAFTGLLALFRDLGLNSALIKYIPEFLVKKEFGKIKYSIISVSLIQLLIIFILILPFFVFSDQIAVSYFHTISASMPLKILLLVFITSIFIPLFQAMLQGLSKMKMYSIIEPLRMSIIYVFTYFFIHLGVIGVAYGYLIASTILSVIIFFYITKMFPFFRAKAHISIALTKKLFLFSLPVFFGGIAGTIILYTDTMVLTFFRSLKEVGLYQVALPTSQMLLFFVGAIGVILFPTVSELWARDKKNILGYGISLMLKFSFILIIPPALLMVTFPEIIIRLFFGEAFLPVVLTLQILSIGSIFYTILSISSMTLMGMGKPFINTKVMFLIALFNLITNILLIPSLGTVGAAATTTISYMIGSFMLLHFLKKNIKIKIPYKPLLKAFIGGFFTLLIILLLKEVLILNPWVEAFICLFLGTIFYMFFILSTKAITKDDLRVLSKINVPIPKLLIKISGRVVRG